MKLIDADLLEPDSDWDEYEDGFISYSKMQIDDAPTVKAIPLDKVEQIRTEIEKRMETITGRYDNSIPEHDRPLCICARNEARQECIEIIDKAIKEQDK